MAGAARRLTSTQEKRIRRQIADDFLAELGYELPATRRVLERVHGERLDGSPDTPADDDYMASTQSSWFASIAKR